MNAENIRLINKALFAVNIYYMGRACKACCKYDKQIAELFAELPSGFVARIGMAPGGAEIFVRNADGKFEVCKPELTLRADLDIRFKNSRVARKFFMGGKSLAAIFSQGQTVTIGDTSQIMVLSRFFDEIANCIFGNNFLKRNGRPILPRRVSSHKLRFAMFAGRLG